MIRRYSVTEARTKLPALLREAEKGGQVEITRRGHPVAVVMSLAEYRRPTSESPRFAEVLAEWTARMGANRASVDRGFFEALRDRSPGRTVDF